MWSHSYAVSNEQNKLMNKIKPEAYIHGTNRQVRGGGGLGDWERLAIEHVYIYVKPMDRDNNG